FPGDVGGQSGGGDVQKAVEVDAKGAVVHGAQQSRRRRAHDRLVQRVRGRESVVHLVPVAVVVLRVEARDPQRGGVRDRAAELLGFGAGRDRVVDGGDDLGRVLGQDRPGQLGDAALVVEGGGAS